MLNQKKIERKKRTIIKSLIDNNGKYVIKICIGSLFFLSSGFSTSSCVKELQREVIKENLRERVGIIVGDIVFENNKVGVGVYLFNEAQIINGIKKVLNNYDTFFKNFFYKIDKFKLKNIIPRYFSLYSD